MKVLIFVILLLFPEILARGGGGRGGFGGGRGFSGARGFSASRGSSIGSRGYGSHYGGGSSYRTSAGASSSAGFRSDLFSSASKGSIFAAGTGLGLTSSLIILSATAPMRYENRNYYWSGNYQAENSVTKCKYEITSEDGKLNNVTFEDGTKPKWIEFGCQHFYERCDGLTCENLLMLIPICIIAILVIAALLYYCFVADQDNNTQKRKNMYGNRSMNLRNTTEPITPKRASGRYTTVSYNGNASKIDMRY